MKLTKILAGISLLIALPAGATHYKGIHVVDKDYLVVEFQDGEVSYRDDGTGPSAFLGHTFVEGDDTLRTFFPRLDVKTAALPSSWQIVSADDPFYRDARTPEAVYRKSKPMHTDHWLFLRLPEPMKEGCTYTVTLPEGSDAPKAEITFDIWNARSEAIHVNLNGYAPSEASKTADLYLWLGDGGPRDYSSYVGKKVCLFRPETGEKIPVGEVSFWKPQEDSRFEARNEVDFFLSIRDPEGGYSQGVTNPDKDWTVMFQAGSTTLAAWLTCPHPRHYPDLFARWQGSLQTQVDTLHLQPAAKRPSRRASYDGRWQTSENLQLVMLDHRPGKIRK